MPSLKIVDPAVNAPIRVTAAQIEKGCPLAVSALGHRIAAHLKKARAYEAKAHKKAGVELRKADDNWNTVTQLLAEAKAKCDVGGFKAFQEKYCPDLSRSYIYELLQIGSGKKTREKSRAEKRARVAKSRQGKKKVSATGDVADEAGNQSDSSNLTNSPAPSEADEYEEWLNAGQVAFEVSARCLKEFTVSCRNLLPKMTTADGQKARRLVGKMTEAILVAPATLDSIIKREWLEAECASEALTAHPVARVVQAIPPGKAALVTEIANYFAALAENLTPRSADNGEAPAAGSDYSIPADLSIPPCLRRSSAPEPTS